MATVNHAISKMLNTPSKITDLIARGNEYCFRFGGHAFSILSRTEDIDKYGEHSFYVYPNWKGSLEALGDVFEMSNDVQMIAYHQNELQEGSQWQLARLAKLVEEKSLKIPEIFDDVVNEE